MRDISVLDEKETIKDVLAGTPNRQQRRQQAAVKRKGGNPKQVRGAFTAAEAEIDGLKLQTNALRQTINSLQQKNRELLRDQGLANMLRREAVAGLNKLLASKGVTEKYDTLTGCIEALAKTLAPQEESDVVGQT